MAEILDESFSREFTAYLQPVLTTLLGSDMPMEIRDSQIVIRAAEDRVIYVDIRAMVLTGVVRKRRPTKRPVRRGQLRLVQS